MSRDRLVPFFIFALLCGLHSPACGEWNSPARFRVGTEVVNASLAPISATIDEGPIDRWMQGGSMEPIHFRTRFPVSADSVNRIELTEGDLGRYNTYREGYLDGALVRVYRITDGSLRLVRRDQVKHTWASGWIERTKSGSIISPEVTSHLYAFDSYSRPDAPQWFGLASVDARGQVSAIAWVASQSPSKLGGKPDQSLVSFTPSPAQGDAAVPPPPLNLEARVEEGSSFVQLNWTRPETDDLAGYRLYISDYDPNLHRGYALELEDSDGEPLKAGDVAFVDLELDQFSRKRLMSNRVWSAKASLAPKPLLDNFYPDEDPATEWRFIEHPEPVPAELAAEGGRTCLWVRSDNRRVALEEYSYGSRAGTWWPALVPGTTYVAEAWMRQEGIKDGAVIFELKGFYDGKVPETTFTVTDEWVRYRTTFTVDQWYEEGNQVGTMGFSFNAPGQLWIDNIRIYPEDAGWMQLSPLRSAQLAEAGLSFIRTHSTIKTPWGYSMEDLTNAAGGMGYSGNGALRRHTLPSLFELMRESGANPWLQVEMCMSEDEWLGFVEYLAAPYDPEVDTPEAKPWAYKRYSQGQESPWTDVFDRIIFELSNETWNGLFDPWTFNFQMVDEVTDATYSGGKLYGVFQRYLKRLFETSPHWPALADRLEWNIGGWARFSTLTGYGPMAAGTAGDAVDWLTIANYNGGWDEGVPAFRNTDDGYLTALTFAVQGGTPVAQRMVSARESQREQGIDYGIGSYEAGPGYAFPGTLSDADKEIEDQVMKSLAAGTATLDNFLNNASLGFGLQNFFMFAEGRLDWKSHAPLSRGGHPYPSWLGTVLFNRFATGDMFSVETLEVPRHDLPSTPRRSAVKDAPMVGCYFVRIAADQYALFLLSRKLDNADPTDPVPDGDGYTPVTVELPFESYERLTLHRMSGPARAHNLDEENVVVEELELALPSDPSVLVVDDLTGGEVLGLPPAATFVYLFEGAVIPPPPAPVVVPWDSSLLPGGVEKGWMRDFLGWIWYDEAMFPWTYSDLLGWIYPIGDNRGTVWVFSYEVGWIWASTETPGYFYHDGLGGWFWFDDSGSFYDMGNDRWIDLEDLRRSND